MFNGILAYSGRNFTINLSIYKNFKNIPYKKSTKPTGGALMDMIYRIKDDEDGAEDDDQKEPEGDDPDEEFEFDTDEEGADDS